MLAAFAKRRADARRRYIQFVAEGKGVDSNWIHLNTPMFLGDEAFVAISPRRKLVNDDESAPNVKRRPPPPSLEAIATPHRSRDAAIIAAHATGGTAISR